MKLWLIAAVGVFLIGVLAFSRGEGVIFAAGVVMVAILWVLFGWMIATVIARRTK